MLGLVDHARHNEEEYREIHQRVDHLLVATEEEAVAAELRSELISMQEPKRAQDTQEP
jgi:hypothetical protein